MTDAERLAAIAADLIHPCPPPDVVAGEDLCPCGTGTVWPCEKTRAAWLIRGLDPADEVTRQGQRWRAAMLASDWDHSGVAW